MTLREADAASRLRQTSRLVVMGAWTALCYLAWLPVAIIALLSGTWSRRWNELAVKVWTGGLDRARHEGERGGDAARSRSSWSRIT
jgi:hypothetical protein